MTLLVARVENLTQFLHFLQENEDQVEISKWRSRKFVLLKGESELIGKMPGLGSVNLVEDKDVGFETHIPQVDGLYSVRLKNPEDAEEFRKVLSTSGVQEVQEYKAHFVVCAERSEDLDVTLRSGLVRDVFPHSVRACNATDKP